MIQKYVHVLLKAFYKFNRKQPITANIRCAFGLGFAIFFSVKIIAFEVILQKCRLCLFLKQFRKYEAIMSPVLRNEKHHIFAERYKKLPLRNHGNKVLLQQ